MEAFVASLVALVLGFSVWAVLKKVGALKGTDQDLTDQYTDRALKATSGGLETLERVIDALEKRIVQQEQDYNEDLERLRIRYEADTKLLKEEVASLRELLEANSNKMARYEAILTANNLMPNE